MSSDLAWIRARLVSYDWGVLSEEDEERFRELLRGNPSCQDLYEEYLLLSTNEDGRDPEHLPLDVLLRWKEADAHLAGPERVAVREHLERCEECRSELSALGFDPALARDPVRERTPTVSGESSGPRPTSGGLLGRAREFLGWPWAPVPLAWAAAATILLVVQWAGKPNGGPGATLWLSAPVNLQTVRGSQVEIPTPAAGEPIVISLDRVRLLDWDASEAVVVLVLDAEGQEVDRMDTTVQALRTSFLVVRLPEETELGAEIGIVLRSVGDPEREIRESVRIVAPAG